MAAEDFLAVLELPLVLEPLAPELAAAGPPDVAAAEPLPKAVDSAAPLAVLDAAAVGSTEPVFFVDADADTELEPMMSSQPNPNQCTNKRCPLPVSCRLMIIPSMLPIDGGHGQALVSVLKRTIAESRGMC